MRCSSHFLFGCGELGFEGFRIEESVGGGVVGGVWGCHGFLRVVSGMLFGGVGFDRDV